MKVIDLLNKIANGEEVPYRIKYIGKIYEYVEEMKWYLREDMKCELSNSKNCLNDEVEIIEEDKKIEKVPIYVLCDYDFKNKDDNNNLVATNIIDKAFEEYAYKINEIIDYIEENKKC